jgi:hypothetical protein
MAYITPTDIKYYRVNANNTAIAQSPIGNSASPTEEIAAPLQSLGQFSNLTDLTVTGDGDSTFLTFSKGQYLYYIDNTGNYLLVGQIDTIASNTSLTITATAVNEPTTNSILAAAYALITNNESIYVRIPTITAGTNQLNMPNFGNGGWRLGSGLNNTSVSEIQQVSTAGTPLSQQSPVINIPFTFITMNIFNTAGQSGGITTYFATSNDFPVYVWIKVTPSIGASTRLSSQTLYRFNTNESQPSITVGLRALQTQLSAAGYNVGVDTIGTSPETGG